MNKYDKDKDYCGPEGMAISKLIPRKLFGVNINYACYKHDVAWGMGDKYTQADQIFRDTIYDAFKAENKPVLGFIVSWTYFLAVRLGRLVLWVKGAR